MLSSEPIATVLAASFCLLAAGCSPTILAPPPHASLDSAADGDGAGDLGIDLATEDFHSGLDRDLHDGGNRDGSADSNPPIDFRTDSSPPIDQGTDSMPPGTGPRSCATKPFTRVTVV